MLQTFNLRSSNFIDISLYNYDLETSIALYIDKDIWSTILGDQYIRTLNETFNIDRSIILLLQKHGRLINLVISSLNHIVKFNGHTISCVDKNLDFSINMETIKNHLESNNDIFLDIISGIANQTKIILSNLNPPQSTCEVSRWITHRANQVKKRARNTFSDCPSFHHTTPIPCRDRNVNMYTFCCSNENTNNHSSNEDIESVVNLSSHTLTQPETAILTRGLKFCPTPGEPDLSEQHADLEKFHLRLKRYLHFYKAPADDNVMEDTQIPTIDNLDQKTPFKHRKFKNPSDWVPPLVSNLENFITKNHLDLSDSPIPKNKFSNVSKQEKEAITQLAKNNSIVIKQADKGGAVVILNRGDYIKEGERQLSDNKFYIKTDEDLTSHHFQQINEKVNDMHIKEEIDLTCYDYLTHTPIRTAQFYMLPKIHKNKQQPPGRPIVSGNGCPTERISQFVDFFPQQGVQKIRSYIQDTTHFLRMLQNLENLPEDTILVTLDVSSLYTNIPNIEGIEACKSLLERERPGASHPTNDSLIDLLTMVLTMNNFDFDENHYLQVGGTAMGTRVAPCYANTFMGWFEDTFVYQYTPAPHLWKRYIDDIFVIWTTGEQTLATFVQHLNGCMPSIKFEMEKSREKVCFLDVTVILNPDGSISTDLYTKPTDSHNYLDYRSAHPKHCRAGIPFSQFLRLKRVCSNDNTFVDRCRDMSRHFIRANYPANIIKDAFNRVYPLDRLELLSPRTQTDKLDPNTGILITTFHPFFRECDQIITRNWDILDRSSGTRPLMNLNIIRGNRRSKNLRDLLVRARLPRINDQPRTGGNHPPNPPPNTPCSRPGCRYCARLNRTGSITSNITNKQYNTRSVVTCCSNNLVYCISCLACGKQYVGQTKRKLSDRLREHFRNINYNSPTHIVGRHFNLPGHRGITSLETHVLCFVRSNPNNPLSRNVRIKAELQWIHRLRSFVPKGLNLMDSTSYI